MPMILGSFSAGIQYGGLHYRRPVCGFFRTGGGWRLCSADECFHLCFGTGGQCWCRCACEPLFRCQRVWKNENDCVYITDQLLLLEHHPWCLWLLFFPCDDERITDSCRYSGGSSAVPAGLFCGLSVLFMYNILSTMFTSISESKFRWDC